MRNGRSNLWRGEALGVGALVLALSFVAFFGATAEAATRPAVLEPVPEVTGAEKVFAFGADGRDALKNLAGRGIPIGDTEPASVADPSGLRWIPEWEWQDDLGFHHFRYRQVVPVEHPALGDSRHLLSDTKYGRDGIALFGGVMGVHYDQRGLLHLVNGAQFREFEMANQLNVHEPETAILLAHSLVDSVDGYEPGDWVTWVPERVDELKARTALRLYPVGDGKGFRLTWEVPSLDAREMPYTLLLDAETGEVWSARPEFAEDSRCQAPATLPDQAGFGPECQSVVLEPNAVLWAVPEPQRPTPHSHTAARPSSWGLPHIEVGQQFWAGSDLLCPGRSYGLVPLETPFLYEDSGTIRGCAAGAALHNTYLTMSSFSGLGWHGFDGNNSLSRIIVDREICDNAWFTQNWQWGGPAVLVGCSEIVRPFSYCLDVVAHEWGHGVIYAKGVGYWGVGEELHEGFADVVGYGVFSTNYQGLADYHWEIGSFCVPPEKKDELTLRSAKEDNGAGSFHVNDQFSSTPHYLGNKLAVAFRMLAEGVANPACGRLGNCHLDPWAFGLSDAFHLFFRALTAYVHETVSWEIIPDLVKLAAFDLFRWCPIWDPPGYSATSEQLNVQEAFDAIGLPSSLLRECIYPEYPD